MDAVDPKYDRLKLTANRIKDIAVDIRNVVQLPSPLGRIIEKRDMANGLSISKITVPLGVVGIIYEARPNVTFDVFSLCLKSGNACILKGGSDAKFSNLAIITIIKMVLNHFKVNPYLGELLPPDREATHEMLHARGYVDVIIPRGSQQLIEYVANNSKIPVFLLRASVPNYQFSPALLAHKAEKWDPEKLNLWLFKPQVFAKGTKMTFPGLPKPQDRADVVGYLNSLK